MPRLSSRARLFRPVLALIATMLSTGGIPGASLRSGPRDLASAAARAHRGAPSDASVRITVRSEPDGAPLESARVRAFAVANDIALPAAQGETDRDGHVRLAGMPRGRLWILADAPGRARASKRLFVGAEPQEVTFALGPEHAVDVIVKNEDSTALVDAEVEAASPGDPWPVGARTGPDGRTRVSRLGPGPWQVTARAAGYDSTSESVSGEGAAVTLVLQRLASLSVRVVGAGDSAMAGAHVSIAGATLWPARATETASDGQVRIGGLLAGVYALRASRGDLVSPIELGVTLGRGEDKSVVLKLEQGRFVAVRVTDEDADDARAIAAARVTVAEGGLSPFPIEATTDGKGRARLGPIASGSATVSVQADGFVPRSLALPDPAPTQLRVALLRAGVLMGRVTDERGYPIDGATIEIVGTDPNGAPIVDDPRRATFQAAHFDAMLGGPAPLLLAGELGVMPGPVPPVPRSATLLGIANEHAPSSAQPWVSKSDGTFRAAPASPGRLRAIVRHPQYVESQSDSVTLAPGGEARADVVMRAGGDLEGRVVDSHDRPVQGARVSVSAVHGLLERSARTASDGTFAFAALPEAVTLTAGANADEPPEIRMTIGIPERAKKEVVVRLPEPRGAVAVTVVDHRDFPIAAAELRASSLLSDAPLRMTVFTDSGGQVSLKGARGLPLRIEATAPGRAPRLVTVEAADDVLRIELAPAESATGEVIAAQSGEAVVGAEITLHSGLGVRRARTDGAGTFSLRDVAPGRASLRVRAPGFAAATRSVAIPDSSGQRAFAIPRIELAAEGVVEGDVVDGRGDPVAGARVAQDHAPTWLTAGARPDATATTDARGRFSLGELAEGTITLEAYAPEFGRGRAEAVRVVAGHTSSGVHVVLSKAPPEPRPWNAPEASGNVAVTLGETGDPIQVVIVSVAAGSEAERAGLEPGDILLAVDKAPVHSMAEAREALGGALSDDVVISVRRGRQPIALRVAREAVTR